MKFDDFCKKLKNFLSETGMSKNAVANIAGVPQSQVSNWSYGKGKRFTENARKVLNIIEDFERKDKPAIPQEIEDALRSAWGGDPKKAKLICDFLKTIEKYLEN